MSKKILLLCRDNTTLSIMAEAVLSKHLSDVTTLSAGVKKAAQIHPAVKKALQSDGLWSEHYKTKYIDSLQERDFTLVIALDDLTGKMMPDFSEQTTIIQIEYDTPNYQSPSQMQKFLKTLKMELIPITRDILEL